MTNQNSLTQFGGYITKALRQWPTVIIAADESAINEAARQIQSLGSSVVPVQADLATLAGVEQLLAALGTRPVDALPANAGRRLGKGFLDPRIPHKPFDQGSARGQQPRLPLRQPNTAARLV